MSMDEHPCCGYTIKVIPELLKLLNIEYDNYDEFLENNHNTEFEIELQEFNIIIYVTLIYIDSDYISSDILDYETYYMVFDINDLYILTKSNLSLYLESNGLNSELSSWSIYG